MPENHDEHGRLSAEDAKLLIKTIEDVEREECEAQDLAKSAQEELDSV